MKPMTIQEAIQAVVSGKNADSVADQLLEAGIPGTADTTDTSAVSALGSIVARVIGTKLGVTLKKVRSRATVQVPAFGFNESRKQMAGTTLSVHVEQRSDDMVDVEIMFSADGKGAVSEAAAKKMAADLKTKIQAEVKGTGVTVYASHVAVAYHEGTQREAWTVFLEVRPSLPQKSKARRKYFYDDRTKKWTFRSR